MISKSNSIPARATLSELRDLGRVLQHGESDYGLLERLCDAAGHALVVDTDALRLVDEGRAIESGGTFELRRGANVRGPIRFTVTERTRHTTAHVSDYDGELIRATEDDAELVATELARTGVSSVDVDAPSYSKQAQTWAKKSLARAKKVFEATATTGLEESLRPKDIIGLRGYGPRFSGFWVADQVTHELGSISTTELDLYNGGV